MKTIDAFRLKKPIAVLIIGCCFVIAAPTNLARALYEGGVSEWYRPELWFELYIKLPASQRAIIALLPVAGVALFLQRKTSWLFAVLILLSICVQNLYCYFTDANVVYPLYVPLTINCCLLVIFYFSRFPYLDKRDRLFRGISKRFNVTMSVKVDGFDHEVVLGNLSNSGCFLRFEAKQLPPALGADIRLCIDGDWVRGRVARRTEGGCGIQFKKPAKLSKRKMKNIISKFNL